jgi:hypothetical protein
VHVGDFDNEAMALWLMGHLTLLLEKELPNDDDQDDLANEEPADRRQRIAEIAH